MKKYLVLFLFLTALTGSAGGIMKLESREIVVANKPTALVVGSDGMLYVAMASQEYGMAADQNAVHSKILRFPSDEAFLHAKDYAFVCDVDGVIIDMSFCGKKLLALQYKDHERRDKEQYNLVSLEIERNRVEFISRVPGRASKLEVLESGALYMLDVSGSYGSADNGRNWNKIPLPMGHLSWARRGDDMFFFKYTEPSKKLFTLLGNSASSGDFTPALEWETSKEIRFPMFDRQGELFFLCKENNRAFIYRYRTKEMNPLLGRELKQKDANIKTICSDVNGGIFISIFENATPFSVDSRLLRYHKGREYISEAFVNVPKYFGQTESYVYFVSPQYGEWRILAFPTE